MKRILLTATLAVLTLMATAQKMELGNFSKIDIDGPYQVKISKASTCGVWLEASSDMAKLVDINVVENELNLSCKEKIYEMKKGSYLRVWVDLPSLDRIEAAGICSIEMQGRFNAKGKEIEIDLDDIASIKGMEIDADKCSVELSDVANLEITGIFSAFELEIGGNSGADMDVTTEKFECEADGNASFEGVRATVANINMDGASKGRLSVTKSLTVKLDENSKLRYSGPNTLEIQTDIRGSAKLDKKLEYR